MDTTCEVCHGHAPADHYLCQACQHAILAWLYEIPHQVAELRTMLEPTTGPAQRGGSGRAHAPLPVRLDVLDLIGPGHAHYLEDPHGDQTGGVPVGAFLAGWAHYIASDVPAVHRDAHGTAQVLQSRIATAWPRSGTGLTAWCTWHARYLPYAATRPFAASFYNDLEGMLLRLRRLTHAEPRTRRLQAPCPRCQSWTLTEREDQLHIACTACPARLTPEEYATHRDQVMPAITAIALRIITAKAKAAA
ncbi:hypothetical protein ACFWHG_19200 [Streptomyces microflavus]|uniref:hypothetical protein n=1 Tax=Streptomyces microflavus TaxID=1919 RepID=UPI00364C4912